MSTEIKVTIPDKAMPVVEVLRRDVPKPTARLVENAYGQRPRFKCGKCPMGLHPDARKLTPALPQSFTPDSDMGRLQIRPSEEAAAPGFYFWTWWDGLTLDQARRAVDLIWPEAL